MQTPVAVMEISSVRGILFCLALVFVLMSSWPKLGFSERLAGLGMCLAALYPIFQDFVYPFWFEQTTLLSAVKDSVGFKFTVNATLATQGLTYWPRPEMEELFMNSTFETTNQGSIILGGNRAGKSFLAQNLFCQLDPLSSSKCAYNTLPPKFEKYRGRVMVWSISFRTPIQPGRFEQEIGVPGPLKKWCKFYKSVMSEWRVEYAIIYVHVTVDKTQGFGAEGEFFQTLRDFVEGMAGVRWFIEMSVPNFDDVLFGGIVARSSVIDMPLLTDHELMDYVKYQRPNKHLDLKKTSDVEFLKKIGGRIGLALEKRKVNDEWEELSHMISEYVMANKSEELTHFYDVFFRSPEWDGVSKISVSEIMFPDGVPKFLFEYGLYHNTKFGKFVLQSRMLKNGLDVGLVNVPGFTVFKTPADV